MARLQRRIGQLETAETALRSERQRLHLILESCCDGFWDWDLTTGVIRFSPHCLAGLGYPAEQALRHITDWQKLIHPEDLPAVTRALETHLAGHEPQYEIEHRLLTQAGEWRWMLARGRVVSRDEQNNPLRMICSCTDITEYKWIEEALQQRNCELALLNHASQAFNSTLDLDQVLISVLSGVRYLLDITTCAIWLVDPETGDLLCRQVSGPGNATLQDRRLPMGQGVAGRAAEQGETLIVADIRTDPSFGDDLDLGPGIEPRSVLNIPLWSKHKVIGVLQVLDVTTERFNSMDATLVESLAATATIAIENARLYEEARQAVEIKSVLLHEVNHRVKNNLSAIIGLLYAEQRHAEANNQTTMEGLIGRVQGLVTVHQLLSSSEWLPLPLSELAKKVIDSTLQSLSPDKHVAVEVLPAPVRVNPRQANSLALLLSELATNVSKHTLVNRQTARITVRISCQEERVSLEFRDDGPGYPEAVLRLEQRNVGLYLIQALVQTDLRGELTLTNDNGAVTTLRFKVAV